QAEDGIRDRNVTGVQTCALPIWQARREVASPAERARAAQRRATAPAAATADPALRPMVRTAGRAMAARAPVPRRQMAATPATRQIGRASCRERVEIGGVAGGKRE